MATVQDPAQMIFRRGLSSLQHRSFQEAAGWFQRAIELDGEHRAGPPRMRFVSFLGLALTMARGRSREAVRLCEQAAKREFYDPDLFCNLGIVYMRNRERRRAFECYRRGLALRPDHQRIHRELDRHGLRGEPLFGFLPRDHTANRVAGRVRSRLRTLLDGNAGRD